MRKKMLPGVKYFLGFMKGKIFRGKTKAVCVPVLNCYSCPGALGACPIGALGLYAVQLVMNFIWSIVFFQLEAVFIPYALWLTFAAYLNLGAYILSKGKS